MATCCPRLRRHRCRRRRRRRAPLAVARRALVSILFLGRRKPLRAGHLFGRRDSFRGRAAASKLQPPPGARPLRLAQFHLKLRLAGSDRLPARPWRPTRGPGGRANGNRCLAGRPEPVSERAARWPLQSGGHFQVRPIEWRVARRPAATRRRPATCLAPATCSALLHFARCCCCTSSRRPTLPSSRSDLAGRLRSGAGIKSTLLLSLLSVSLWLWLLLLWSPSLFSRPEVLTSSAPSEGRPGEWKPMGLAESVSAPGGVAQLAAVDLLATEWPRRRPKGA